MGDFIRYILTAPHDLTLRKLHDALREIDGAFAIISDTADPAVGDLLFDSAFYGEIAVNAADDPIVQEDMDELRELLTDDDPEAQVIRARLDQMQGMVALNLSEAGHNDYDRIDPIWDWLFTHYDGVLQVDDEGFYDQAGLIA